MNRKQILEILFKFILFISLKTFSVCRIIINEEMLLIAKKVIVRNLPYFYQNSLKFFINLTDCWKKIWQLWVLLAQLHFNAEELCYVLMHLP